ncbi:MAG: hypothetical protein NC543_10980 [bacterium]|nr:hypothetical protein [bacterium]MCM1374664.1 hypothetical protein [Muribaculum sp.]
METLCYFIDYMAVRTRNAVFIDTTENDFFLKILEMDSEIDENTHVITFNNTGVNLPIGNGENYWEIKNVKLHNIQVDTPIFYKSTLDLNLNCMQIVSIDGYHDQFTKRYYPIYRKSIFVPHGGSRDERYIKRDEENDGSRTDGADAAHLYICCVQGCGSHDQGDVSGKNYRDASPEYAKTIIDNQRQRAADQTWADRLEEIIGSLGC